MGHQDDNNPEHANGPAHGGVFVCFAGAVHDQSSILARQTIPELESASEPALGHASPPRH